MPGPTRARSGPPSWAVAAFALACAAVAHATPALRLSVVRSQDAADCPDDVQLAALVAALSRPDAPPAGSVLVDAQFFRQQEQYAVTLRVSGDRSGQRALVDPGPTCAGLAEAAALTVAMLLDPGRPRPAAPPPVATTSPPPPRPPPPPTSEPPALLLSAGALLTTGITANPAVGAVSEVSLQGKSGWRLGLGGAWLPARTFDLPPGKVEVALLTGLAHGCWLRPGRWFNAGACARLGVGRYVAEARGFSRNGSPRDLWIGAGATGVIQIPLAQQIFFEGQGGLMPSLRHRSFAIEGLGVAFEPTPWAGTWFSASLSLQAW